MKRRKHTDETKRKISLAHKNSEKSKLNQARGALFFKENKFYNVKYPELQNKKWLHNQYIVLEKSGEQIARNLNCTAVTVRHSLIKFGIKMRSRSQAQSGRKNHRWKEPNDRKINVNRRIRQSDKYKIVRKRIFERDNYTCLHCGCYGGALEVDHIKPLAVIIKENNIIDVEQAYICQEMWNKDNLRTLCKKCHTKTDTYLYKIFDKHPELKFKGKMA